MNPIGLKRKPLPEIIFLGRSNVGKSSLINCLLNHKKLARTSSTPGKTRLFFFYEIEEKLLFVDPPGFGYAKVSREERARWLQEMERYLREAEMLLGVILIMDVRHAPTSIDYDMAEWLAGQQIRTAYALNKIDKLSRSKLNQSLNRFEAMIDFPNSGIAVPFSAQNKTGRSELWSVIDQWRELI
ncbi:ribosome biogenesis GTP-binding protein YihA/YsxC [bacterium]|nr:ribosome biogenesis GTP-binding protein YihA/YsxC [bacterium]MBU1881496.1 ribosome biogenesis GTP-binding protein YihA/YsxC [bacterium]